MSRWMLGVLVLAWMGCADGSVVDHTRDPDLFAWDVKEVTASSVAEARGSDEPADALFNLVDMLADLGAQPTGPHLSIYQEMRTMANQIYEDAQAEDERPEGLDERLDALWALAEQLPGEVQEPQVAVDD